MVNVAKLQNMETKNDALYKALQIVRKIPIGETKLLSELVTKKGGESFLMEAVKRLIDSGWIEYEFTNDYTGLKRLNLPEHAKEYLKTIYNEKCI